MEVHVPHDVILNHILPRIPAKSVCRFKCVSKEWHSLFTSDMFKNKHNRHIDDHKNNPKLLVLYKTKTSLFEFTTIDFEAPPSDKGLTTPTRRPLPQFKDTNPHKIHILTSFHGLVCLGTIKDKHDLQYSDLILWNPLTNEYKRLSKSDSHKECNNISLSSSDFGLYYSCCEDDYKLVFVNYEVINVYIYSLKTDSWRKVDDVSQHISILHPGSWSTGGTYLNENIYFLRHLDERVGSIIRFDTKTERLSNIETSNVDANPDTSDYFATIMVKSDCIHVCVMYDDIDISGFERTCIKLWKLDEYGNVKEVVSYQLGPPQVYDIPISPLIPFHFTKNGNWLTRNLYTQEFYEVDLKKEMRGNIYDDFEYRKVGVDDNTKNKKIFDKEVRYIETFVSPNPYMK